MGGHVGGIPLHSLLEHLHALPSRGNRALVKKHGRLDAQQLRIVAEPISQALQHGQTPGPQPSIVVDHQGLEKHALKRHVVRIPFEAGFPGGPGVGGASLILIELAKQTERRRSARVQGRKADIVALRLVLLPDERKELRPEPIG